MAGCSFRSDDRECDELRIVSGSQHCCWPDSAIPAVKYGIANATSRTRAKEKAAGGDPDGVSLRSEKEV
jgi:hypothetical protein